ncbi:hypothetical protein [Haloarchaeobius sp. FL176]|uniref:hypothetical protein n=1 Tax=Haloarchaeobius sp. FL176 TaxID=2967129 RepID=UPI00214840F9|nr:hypothetical protein [Haloarchaeobius sp. FL176]
MARVELPAGPDERVGEQGTTRYGGTDDEQDAGQQVAYDEGGEPDAAPGVERRLVERGVARTVVSPGRRVISSVSC